MTTQDRLLFKLDATPCRTITVPKGMTGEEFVFSLHDKLEAALRENERLRNAIGNLEPLRGIDWHGKWRIHGCLEALSNKDSEPKQPPEPHP